MGRNCHAGAPRQRGNAPLNELPVRLEDVEMMLQHFRGSYPGHDPEPVGQNLSPRGGLLGKRLGWAE
jgi:hypothetical protein